MNPCLPYGWQAKGETVGITPQSNRKTNVFGIFNADNQSFVKLSAQNINSQFVVAAIDECCNRLPVARPTVLVLDNASPHHSRLFKSNLEKWQTRKSFKNIDQVARISLKRDHIDNSTN